MFDFENLPDDLKKEVSTVMNPEKFGEIASDVDNMLEFLSEDPDSVENFISREYFLDYVWWFIDHRLEN